MDSVSHHTGKQYNLSDWLALGLLMGRVQPKNLLDLV